jgi:lipid II:glycine glycyltransferase (peptidoglycan interpeptide bridge formation enzyme)
MAADTLDRAAQGGVEPNALLDERELYDVAEDCAPSNPEWDAFVEATPGGHHAQTSMWAQVKGSLGWDAVRVIVRERGAIVGGVQLLTRRVSAIGSVAFAPRGPILATSDPRLLDAVLKAAMALGRARRIRYLKLQPPVDRPDLVDALKARGWVPSAVEAAPSATVQVRLDRPEEDILARMRRSTRRGARQSVDRGLEIRVGGASDFPALHAMIASTAERQGFEHYPMRYYETMWRVFAERDQALLLLGEMDGELLAAHLYIGFNDCVTAKAGGWSGQARTGVRPNAALDWAAMRWARERGFRAFDFDGIAPSVARALARGEDIPEAERNGVAEYKLGFGGSAMLLPSALDNSPSAILRPAVRAAAPHLTGLRSTAHRVLGRGS